MLFSNWENSPWIIFRFPKFELHLSERDRYSELHGKNIYILWVYELIASNCTYFMENGVANNNINL